MIKQERGNTMNDELWIDNDTGELITATEAIHRHYQDHDTMSDWTAFYTFTGQYSDTLISQPDFTSVVRR